MVTSQRGRFSCFADTVHSGITSLKVAYAHSSAQPGPIMIFCLFVFFLTAHDKFSSRPPNTFLASTMSSRIDRVRNVITVALVAI